MSEFEGQEPIIRDKRRIDPDTGTVRPDAAAAGAQIPGAGVSDAAGAGPSMTPPMAPPATVGGPNDGAAEAELAERTADLQRLQAEFANYRKRVERDRQLVRDRAVIDVLSGLLPVLDDIGRAGDHGELVGGFKVVADSLQATLAKLGLQPFGEEGDPFDPNVHEALMHEYSSEVSAATCVAILGPGYKIGEIIVRPARVKVAEPEFGAAPQEN